MISAKMTIRTVEAATPTIPDPITASERTGRISFSWEKQKISGL